jgi:hypothetical protein
LKFWQYWQIPNSGNTGNHGNSPILAIMEAADPDSLFVSVLTTIHGPERPANSNRKLRDLRRVPVKIAK